MIPTLEQIDELHRNIAPSKEAYDLIHTHCVIVARIARALAHRQNMLFSRRCTLPKDAKELQWLSGGVAAASDDGECGYALGGTDCAMADAAMADGIQETAPAGSGSLHIAAGVGLNRPAHAPTWTVPPSDGIEGGRVPGRLIDERLVVIGGLLHDIGTYRVLKHDGSDGEPLKFSGKRYILHGLLGYEYLLEQGVDEEIAQFARNHTGVGLRREDVERQGLPLPPDDYVPMNLEQETVMVADKYHSKSVPPKFVSAQAYTARAERFGEENKRRWLDVLGQYGTLDVAPLAEEYGMRMI